MAIPNENRLDRRFPPRHPSHWHVWTPWGRRRAKQAFAFLHGRPTPSFHTDDARRLFRRLGWRLQRLKRAR
jgi:hypothetical protein